LRRVGLLVGLWLCYSGGGAPGVLTQNVIVYGWWKKDWATEFFAGFSKAADTFATTNTTNSASTSASSINSVSGVKNPYMVTVGGGQNYRISHSKWIQIYSGYFGGLTYTTNTSYSTGSTATSVANTATPTNYTTSYSNVGSVTSSTQPLVYVGGKLGAEFYLKWFPNLALGFQSGLVTTFGGNTTTSTSTKSGSDTYTGGVPASPSPVSSSNSSSSVNPGLTANTFGLGGTVFQLTGSFTLRYVW
jgi:hypothetical protein